MNHRHRYVWTHQDEMEAFQSSEVSTLHFLRGADNCCGPVDRQMKNHRKDPMNWNTSPWSLGNPAKELAAAGEESPSTSSWSGLQLVREWARGPARRDQSGIRTAANSCRSVFSACKLHWRRLRCPAGPRYPSKFCSLCTVIKLVTPHYLSRSQILS